MGCFLLLNPPARGHESMQPGNTGTIFPGQGSQKIGMLADLGAAHSIVSETFGEASEVLGYDLWSLSQTGTEEELAKTPVTQPAILTASVAIWRLWQQKGGVVPALMAGHSLGEYSALTCAGVFEFSDAVSLVQKRGQYMQDAVPLGVGSMAAIVGLEDDKVISACEEAKQGQEVAAVNFNSPGQVAIAGHAEAVARAGELCKEAGAKRVLPLPVSAPFHSPLMKPAAEKFAADLAAVSLGSPQIPVLQNYGLACETDPGAIRENLVKQVYNPVPWVDTINYFADNGIGLVLEMGPGRVLGGLNRRIRPEMGVLSVNDEATLEEGLGLSGNA